MPIWGERWPAWRSGTGWAYRDALTGLWNRRYFDEHLVEELPRTSRTASGRLSVMVADMNDLKDINNILWHEAGDVAIQSAAEFLKASLRVHDVWSAPRATS